MNFIKLIIALHICFLLQGCEFRKSKLGIQESTEIEYIPNIQFGYDINKFIYAGFIPFCLNFSYVYLKRQTKT